MSRTSTWQHRQDPRLATWSLRRWLVLLLVLAFSTSGLVHVPIGGHFASAASLSHEITSVGEDVTAEPDCAGVADDAHGATCCAASVCYFSFLLISSATTTMAKVAEVVASLADEIFHGRALSPGLRPPSLSANV